MNPRKDPAGDEPAVMKFVTYPPGARFIGPGDDVVISSAVLTDFIDAQVRARLLDELEDLSSMVIEPCEPDCDDVRHALHQGSWNAHLVIEDRIDALRAAVVDGEKRDA